MKQIADISAGKKSYTVKKLSKGKYYKYMLIAYKEICKEKRMIASSVTVHCVTKGGKYKNPTGLSYDKKKIILKPKKCVTLKPTQKSNGKVKEHIAKFHYESSDPTIATVNKKGKVKGIKTGKCYIYIYTQNGLYKRIAVHVK